MQTVREAVEELGRSFAEFKATNELNHRTKSSSIPSEPLLEEKLLRIGDNIDRISTRLERMQTARLRPSLEAEDYPEQGEQEYKKAFLNYVRKGEESALQTLERKSLSSAAESDGGYLIPQKIVSQLGQHLQNSSTMRKIAGAITISTDAIEFLVDQKGAEAGWTTETGERNETESPTLAKLRIPVYEMYAKPKATQKLLEDSRVDVEAWLSSKVSEKMAYIENHAFFHGDGEGKPKGFLAYPKTYDASEADKVLTFKTGRKGAFAAQHPADIFIDTLNSLKPEFLQGAVWVMSRSALAAARKLKDSNGHYLWQIGTDGDFRQKLLGYPVEVSDEMPPLVAEAESTSIAFGNFKRAYQIVDRAGTRVLRDPYSAKPYVEFYITRRVGGDLVENRAVSLIEFNS